MFGVYFAVLAVVAGGAWAGYSGSSSSSGNELGHGSASDGNGYGYGFSGSFSGNNPPPNFAFPQFDFSGFLGNYLDSLQRYHQEFIKNLQANNVGGGYGQPGGFSGGYGGSYGGGNGGSYSGGTGGSYGGSFSGGDGAGFPFPASDGGSYGGSFGPGSGGAAASASFGPGGIHQTAAVYPENPGSPNINTRFGGGSSGQPGGFHSVFTSSQSHTANVDGKPVTVQRASTTVNDNGKVTTYTAKNP